jgi:CubicO group peptidase (beta-lactamase class C family)
MPSNQPLSNYWPAFKNSNKENIKNAEFLTHQAGLPAWIPFWMMVADKKGKSLGLLLLYY